jgi:hypothetical protein
MKLRIQGNSLRLRLSRPDMARLVEKGRVEETIQFAPESDAILTYSLSHAALVRETAVRYELRRIAVEIPTEWVDPWANTDQVGIYASIEFGAAGKLEVILEKDFACLDREEGNEDKFSNPQMGAVC